MAQSANMDASELARDIAAGLASATTATERAALVSAELVEAIQQLKTQRDAVILAHYYVAPEVQAVADYVGDSFYLAKLAKSLPQQTIVLCGVEFMGESAKLLNPTKTVLLPEPGADCPMAHMVKRETVDAAVGKLKPGRNYYLRLRAPSTATTWLSSATSPPRSRSRAGATCASPAPTPSRSCPSCRSSISCSFPTKTSVAS